MPKPFNELEPMLQVFIRAYRAIKDKMDGSKQLTLDGSTTEVGPTGSRFRFDEAQWGGSYGNDGWCLFDQDEGLAYWVSSAEMAQYGQDLKKGEALKFSRFEIGGSYGTYKKAFNAIKAVQASANHQH